MAGVTRKLTELLARPPTVTTTAEEPAAAPFGTEITTLVPFQLAGVSAAPPKVTVLVPCEVPKFAPEIVIDVPTGPDAGLRLLMLGGMVTVKPTPLLATPPTVTTTLPVVAPVGTGTATLAALQLVGVAVVPLKVTVPLPCVPPKLLPVIVTEVPTAPEVGDRLVMLGAGTTVKVTPLLATPPAAVTTTLPVVAPAGTVATMLVLLQLVGVA